MRESGSAVPGVAPGGSAKDSAAANCGTKNTAVLSLSQAEHDAIEIAREQHGIMLKKTSEYVQAAYRYGEAVSPILAALPWGTKAAFIRDNLPGGRSTTYNCLAVFKHFGPNADLQIVQHAGRIGDLSIRRVLKSKTKPRPTADTKQKSIPAKVVTDERPPIVGEYSRIDDEPAGAVEKVSAQSDTSTAPAVTSPKPTKAQLKDVERLEAEVATLTDKIKEANTDLVELGNQMQPLQDEVDFLRKIENEGDKLAAACAEVKRLQAALRAVEDRLRGLQNEKNADVQWIKYWKRKHDALERKLKKLEGGAK